jgi:predicted lysophospholipase L1 biosynthesis ABC-type transport system permease subunit
VVDRVLAEQLWGDPGAAVGETLVWGDLEGSHLHVTGVVEPVRDFDLTEDPTPMIYRLHRQIPWAAMGLVVATDRAGPELGNAIRDAVAQAAPGLPIPEVQPLGDAVQGALAQPRFNLVVMAAFAALGLLLSLLGLYAVTAYEVRQRYREIGIRLSLGARPSSIRRSVLLGGVRLVLAGTALGVVLLVWLAPTVTDLLHGVSYFDPLSWGGAVALLVAMTLVAGEIPARRATRIDPRSVIQGE